MLRLVLDARGGKIGSTGCLPIEVDGSQTCKGALAIGRFLRLHVLVLQAQLVHKLTCSWLLIPTIFYMGTYCADIV